MSTEGNHETMVIGTPNGYLPTCKCGWRGSFGTYFDAAGEGDKHVIKKGVSTAGRMSVSRTIKFYRDNQDDPRFTESEQALWRGLADELERYFQRPEKGPIEGQIALSFD